MSKININSSISYSSDRVGRAEEVDKKVVGEAVHLTQCVIVGSTVVVGEEEGW